MVPKKNDIQYNIHKIKLFLFVIKFTMVEIEKIWLFYTMIRFKKIWYYFTFYFLHSFFYSYINPLFKFHLKMYHLFC